MKKKGLFVGLLTLDFIYLVSDYPRENQKVVAQDYIVSAGGPATNAAITFSHLGGESCLVGVGGSHPMMELIRTDFRDHRLSFYDLDSHRLESPPISSILVTESTGNRTVVSLNATRSQVMMGESFLLGLESWIAASDIILIDGHQIAVSERILQQNQVKKIPVVLDGGSWKIGLESVLSGVDYAICSANFYPPHCHTEKDVFAYLMALGIPYIAITHGEKPIQYYGEGQFGEIPIPSISVRDTLGAGDIFHGAFCYYILQQPFIRALHSAAQVAAISCQFFGTRSWMAFPYELYPDF